MKVQELTKTEFLKKVANYEASPNKWVYKGDKPCIVDFYAPGADLVRWSLLS